MAVKSTTISLSPASARALSKPSCEHKSMLDFIFCHQFHKELFLKTRQCHCGPLFLYRQQHVCNKLQSHDYVNLVICLYIIPNCGVKPATPLTCCSRPAFIRLCALLDDAQSLMLCLLLEFSLVGKK